MEQKFCDSCERTTGHGRCYGLGTVILLIVTCGVWLLALPVYPSRCHVCGKENGLTVVGVVGLIFLIIALYACFFFPGGPQ